MFTEAQNHAEGLTINHTPASALSAGQMLQVGGRAAFACEDIAASAEGAVQVQGLAKIAAGAVVGNVGDNVWWDEDGSPYGGVASSGCATTNAAVGDFWIGTLAKALTATAGEAIVALNEVNPLLPPWTARRHIKKTADYTVLDTDCGSVIHCDGSAESDDIIVITMPATSPGFECIIQNDAADGASQITIEVNAADKFCNPIALDDGDTLDNTLATAIRGDFVRLVATTNGWYVAESRGVWADGGAT